MQSLTGSTPFHAQTELPFLHGREDWRTILFRKVGHQCHSWSMCLVIAIIHHQFLLYSFSYKLFDMRSTGITEIVSIAWLLVLVAWMVDIWYLNLNLIFKRMYVILVHQHDIFIVPSALEESACLCQVFDKLLSPHKATHRFHAAVHNWIWGRAQRWCWHSFWYLCRSHSVPWAYSAITAHVSI